MSWYHERKSEYLYSNQFNILLERDLVNGNYICTDLDDDYSFKMVYIGYPKQTVLKMFRQEIRERR
jgi:hypothetical protein